MSGPPDLLYEIAPCPKCGAETEIQAETGMCRPSSDETGESYCPGEFRNGVSVRPTAESLAVFDAWIAMQAKAEGLT